MKKIFFLILIIALAGGGYYLWQHRYDYFFKGDQIQTKDEGGAESGFVENGNKEEATEQDAEEAMGNEELNASTNPEFEIKDYDCDMQCENRKDTDKYKYCLEICGLSALGNGFNQSDNCENLSDFDRDVCFKNKAIKEKNDSNCDQIQDAQLKESCQKRVVEEIL